MTINDMQRIKMLKTLATLYLFISPPDLIVAEKNFHTPRQLKPCNPCNPACSARHPQRPGHIRGVGVLYSVSGSLDWALTAFVPAINYLKEIGIPDAAHRRRRRHDDSPKYALVTEPHICRSLSPDVLSFFDVLITFSELPGNRHNPTLVPADDDDDDDDDASRRGHRRQRIYSPGAPLLGQGSKADRKNLDLRHYVKAFKVHAMNFAPFETTIYMDVDLIPCSKDSVRELLDIYGTEVDVSLHPEFSEVYDIPKDEDEHYQGNTHNSALVIMNLKSPRVHDFLREYETIMYSKENRPKIDQPSLGWAMSVVSKRGGFTHNDISDDVYCKDWKRTDSVYSSCSAGCIFMHKVEEARLAPHDQLLGGKTPNTTTGQSPGNHVIFLKSLATNSNFPFDVSKESCAATAVSSNEYFRPTKDLEKGPKLMAMVRPPRESLFSLFLECHHKTVNGQYDGAHSSVAIHFESWLDRMIESGNSSRQMRDDSLCNLPWNVQSQMIICGDPQSSLEPPWDVVKEAATDLDFVGLTNRYAESMCLIHYVNGGCDAVTSDCDCLRNDESYNDSNAARDNSVSLQVSAFNRHILRKMDLLTRVDAKYAKLASLMFKAKLKEVKEECGLRISCK